MGHKQNGSTLISDLVHFVEAFLLKTDVTHCQHFVHCQFFVIQMDGDRECEPQIHAARVPFDGCVNKLFDLRKGHDLVETASDLSTSDSQDRTVHENILAAR